MGKITIRKEGKESFMKDKKGDGVPTIGTKNIGRQKYRDVESAEELAPTEKGTTKFKDKTEKTKQKMEK